MLVMAPCAFCVVATSHAAAGATVAGADCRMFDWRQNDAKIIAMARRKNIALVAHDNKKEELVEWAKSNCKLLGEHSLYSTSTTGQLLKGRLGLKVTLLESGPLGGDQQIGSRISEGQIDFVIFFSDPLQSTSRSRCESAPPHHRGVERSGRVQSSFRRLPHLIAIDVDGI
jgi:hypothetical protein